MLQDTATPEPQAEREWGKCHVSSPLCVLNLLMTPLPRPYWKPKGKGAQMMLFLLFSLLGCKAGQRKTYCSPVLPLCSIQNCHTRHLSVPQITPFHPLPHDVPSMNVLPLLFARLAAGQPPVVSLHLHSSGSSFMTPQTT